MPHHRVYLFPDTNLFLQCRQLGELAWVEIGKFDEIVLIISRPVQREIDLHKTRGNDRLGRRSRAASGLIRQVIHSPNFELVVRDAQPRVILTIRPEIGPIQSLANVLDYQERDDQLIGTTCCFAETSPNEDVRLLTHDTMPLATAKRLKIPAIEIPDSWLLEPEVDEAAKRVRKLEGELARLKEAEPLIEMNWIHGRDDDEPLLNSEAIECCFAAWGKLGSEEIESLMKELISIAPLGSEFGSPNRIERPLEFGESGITIPSLKEVYLPASAEEISEYQVAHARWLSSCRKRFAELHREVEQQTLRPLIMFEIKNSGSRPAKDVLLTFEVSGELSLFPSDNNKHGNVDGKVERLASPPVPPRGEWIANPFWWDSDAVKQAAEFERVLKGVTIPDTKKDFAGPSLTDLMDNRDPNKFHFKHGRPVRAKRSIAFECTQWRHGENAMYFGFYIYFPTQSETASGLLECRLEAENLTESCIRKVPIRIQLNRNSVREKALELLRHFKAKTHDQSSSMSQD